MKGCAYVVHSRCATRKDVWDGKELEEEPEEVYENLNSFEVIGDKIIQHFSHSHHMRFEKEAADILYDGEKRCRVCVLPLYRGGVYKCVNAKCDFVLHEKCASLPRKKQHMAYRYPLTLQVSDTKTYFYCYICDRDSCGFKYVCLKEGNYLSLDVRCAAISEPFDHRCHQDPLFLSNELRRSKTCSMCGREDIRTLNCIECDFILCFPCATLPDEVRYEYDEHFLTLSYEENVSPNFCEVCEETLDSPIWLYTCNECGVTLHITCLLGKGTLYMNPAKNILLHKRMVSIIPNNGLTRPICSKCGRRCQDKVMFETSDGRIFCYHWEMTHPMADMHRYWEGQLI